MKFLFSVIADVPQRYMLSEAEEDHLLDILPPAGSFIDATCDPFDKDISCQTRYCMFLKFAYLFSLFVTITYGGRLISFLFCFFTSMAESQKLPKTMASFINIPNESMQDEVG
jgi:hypothetical protein